MEQVGFLEFEGEGLKELRDSSAEKEKQMALLGAIFTKNETQNTMNNEQQQSNKQPRIRVTSEDGTANNTKITDLEGREIRGVRSLTLHVEQEGRWSASMDVFHPATGTTVKGVPPEKIDVLSEIMGIRWHNGAPIGEESSELLAEAWGLIANAYHGDWTTAPDTWRLPACRWRDKFQKVASSEEALLDEACEIAKKLLEFRTLATIASESGAGNEGLAKAVSNRCEHLAKRVDEINRELSDLHQKRAAEFIQE